MKKFKDSCLYSITRAILNFVFEDSAYHAILKSPTLILLPLLMIAAIFVDIEDTYKGE